MSIESTVSTAWGCIDVANASQVCLTINSQNENGGSGKSEISEFLCYPRNFFNRTTGGLPKDEEADAVCGPIGRPDQKMEVELLTWCQQMVRQC